MRVPIPATDGLKPRLQWRVDTGQKSLICAGDGQHEWLRFDQVFGDYVLEVDFRFAPKGADVKYNSGIGIRLSPWGELWTQAQTGPTGGYLFGVNLGEGVLQRFNLMKEMKENRIKPAGEWNHYEIRVQGGQDHAFGERRRGQRDCGNFLAQGLHRAGSGRARDRVSQYQGDGAAVDAPPRSRL
jgi:hypothetical protein